MSFNNKNIDKLFNEAANAQAAPEYKSEYWTEMGALLQKRDAQKRGFLYWTLGGVLMLAVLIPFLFTSDIEKSSTPALYTQEATTDVEANQVGATQNTDLKRETGVAIAVTESSTSDKVISKQSFQQNSSSLIIPSNAAPRSKQVKSQPEKLTPALGNKIHATPIESKKGRTEAVPFYLTPKTRSQISEQDFPELVNSGFVYKPMTRIALYGKFSGGIMENYKTRRPFESGIMDLSLNLEFKLRHNLLLRTGLGTQFTTNADLTVSQRTKATDFQEKDIQTDLSYQNLYDLYIPIEFGYQFKGTSFGIGVQANYLMDTRIDVNRFEDFELVSEEKLKGAKSGLNTFSTQGYVWVEQRLAKRISLGLKVGTNISGRIKNTSDFINESATTNPLYGQLTLRYDFIK